MASFPPSILLLLSISSHSLTILISAFFHTASAANWYGDRPGVEPRSPSGVSSRRSRHTRDFKLGTEVVGLPGAWRDRVRPRTGWFGLLWLGEIASLICHICLSVAARILSEQT